MPEPHPPKAYLPAAHHPAICPSNAAAAAAAAPPLPPPPPPAVRKLLLCCNVSGYQHTKEQSNNYVREDVMLWCSGP
eukprot:1142075-Pelagomonas_calceolata.AAC.3